MLRVAVALGLVATVGCRQLAPAPAAIERPAAATVVRAASMQADSPRDNTRERASKVRGRPVATIRHDGIQLGGGCCATTYYWHRGRWRSYVSAD